jgi:hypothetical protein
LLTHPTTERLRDLGLTGMARALEEMRRQPNSVALDFEERLALLVDRERLERDTKRLQTRLRFAGLRCRPHRRISITARLVASIVRCSKP